MLIALPLFVMCAMSNATNVSLGLLQAMWYSLVAWGLVEFVAALKWQYCTKGRTPKYKHMVIGWWVLVGWLILVAIVNVWLRKSGRWPYT